MSPHKRVAPRPLVGLLIFVGYSVLFTRADATVSDVIPLWIAAIGALALVRVLGWTGQVFHEVRRTPRWTLAIPVLLAAGVLVGLFEISWQAFEPRTVLLALVATGGLAVAEEVVTRGLLLVALRARYRELAVWFWTSLLFGVVHGIHATIGQPPLMIAEQIGLAFLLGSVLYATRRATGTLFVPVVLHVLWDFTISLGWHPGMAIAYAGAIVFAIAAAKRVLFRIGSTYPRFAHA